MKDLIIKFFKDRNINCDFSIRPIRSSNSLNHYKVNLSFDDYTVSVNTAKSNLIERLELSIVDLQSIKL